MKTSIASVVIVVALAACGGRAMTPDAEPAVDQGGMSETQLSELSSGTFFNVNFGGPRPAVKTGPAAAGNASDYWNAVVIGFNDEHTERGLLGAKGEQTPIEVRLSNLGGSWGQQGTLALSDEVLSTYQYPTNNQGGNAHVTLGKVPGGDYTLLIYGVSANPDYYGDYSVSSGGRDYGRKKTKSGPEAASATRWTDGVHFVSYEAIHVSEGGEIEILIQPGGLVSDAPGRTFRDAYICGLQLVRRTAGD